VDFLKRLMTPILPRSVLFMLQSGYFADRIMPIMLDSINGLNNESNRLRRPADPEFTRLVELMREGQLAGAIQIRIERPKDGAESSVLIFGPSKGLAAGGAGSGDQEPARHQAGPARTQGQLRRVLGKGRRNRHDDALDAPNHA